MLYLFLICFFIVMLIGKRVYKTYANPIAFFVGVFFIAFFLLYSVDFISRDSLNDTIWVMYILSFVCFFLGILLSRNRRFRLGHGEKLGYDSENEQVRYVKEILLLFVIAAIATLIYWMQAVRLHGISGFINSLLTTQETDNLGGMPVIILYIKMVTIFLSPYTLNYIIEYKIRKPIYFAILIFTFAANIAYTRNVLFYIALLDLFVFIYTHIKENEKVSFKWILYIAVGVLAFRFFSFTQTLLNKQFEVRGTFLGTTISGPLVTVISYFTGPLISTGIYYTSIRDVPFLGYTFRNLLGFINSFGLATIDTNIYMPQTWVYIPFKFNTTTIQLYIFKEGGWIWLVIFFIILGFLADRLFLNYRNNKSRYTLMLLSFVSLVLVTGIRSYIVTRLDMFFYCLILFILYISRFVVFGSNKRGGVRV